MTVIAALTPFILAVGAYPLIVTKGTDMIRNLVDRNRATPLPPVLWNVVPFVLGIILAVVYEKNFASLIPNLPPALQDATGVKGEVLTGLGIGAIASGWHELLDSWSAKAKLRKAQATRELAVSNGHVVASSTIR